MKLINTKVDFRFLILPVIYISLCFLYHLDRGPYYLNYVDPEYTFLYNAAAVVDGNLGIEFIDHPGTPLIFITAFATILLWIIQLCPPFLIDFVSQAEFYLHTSVLFNLILIGWAIYISSKMIYRSSRSLALAIIPSLGVLMNQYVLDISSRLIPESTILIPLLLIMGISFKYLYDPEKKMQNHTHYTLLLPLLIAFGVACKIYFLTFFLFPFLFIRYSSKLKVSAIFVFLLSLILFAFPLFTNFNRSSEWFLGLFTHSGLHGGGEENFIDFTGWPRRMLILYLHDKLYWILLGINLIVLIIMLFKKDLSDWDLKLRRWLFALIISILIMGFFTLKHFSPHYFMPFFAFKGLLLTLPLLFIYRIKLKSTHFLPNTYFKLGITVACLSIMSFQINEANNFRRYKKEESEERKTAAKQILSKIDPENSAVVANPAYYGSPFPEYAHHFGLLNSYGLKDVFLEALINRYPNFYMKLNWMEGVSFWSKELSLDELLSKYESIYLFEGSGNNEMEAFSTRITEVGRAQGKLGRSESIYTDEEGRKLIKLTFSKGQ